MESALRRSMVVGLIAAILFSQNGAPALAFSTSAAPLIVSDYSHQTLSSPSIWVHITLLGTIGWELHQLAASHVLWIKPTQALPSILAALSMIFMSVSWKWFSLHSDPFLQASPAIAGRMDARMSLHHTIIMAKDL